MNQCKFTFCYESMSFLSSLNVIFSANYLKFMDSASCNLKGKEGALVVNVGKFDLFHQKSGITKFIDR